MLDHFLLVLAEAKEKARLRPWRLKKSIEIHQASSFPPWAAMHLLEWDARAGVLCADEDSSSFRFPSSHVKSLIGQ